MPAVDIERIIRARNGTIGLQAYIGEVKSFQIIEACHYQSELSNFAESPVGVLEITENFALLYCKDGVLEISVVIHQHYGYMSMRRFAEVEQYQIGQRIILTPPSKHPIAGKNSDQLIN